MAADKANVQSSQSSDMTGLNPQLNSLMTDPKYREAVKSAAAYNKKLMKERKTRLPFIDAHTGVAQSDCQLWRKEHDRLPPRGANQVISYPTRRWQKKRRKYLLNNFFGEVNNTPTTVTSNGIDALNDAPPPPLSVAGMGVPTPVAQLITPNGAGPSTNNTNNVLNEDSKDSWMREYDDASDLPDAGELDDPESDFDDDEEYGSRKKKNKRKSEGIKKRASAIADVDKPFICEICGARYKTRPGLVYHHTHSHADVSLSGSAGPATPASSGNGLMSSGGDSHDGFPKPPMSGVQATTAAAASNSTPPGERTLPTPHKLGPGGEALRNRLDKKAMRELSSKSNGRNSPQNYCDFCLGDTAENRKTNSPEELVSCSDCGRAAHPTCLQFTDNMILSVKKYRWQCMECKSCGLCGTSDNDEQLLFCDDCDRGYHMYCLKPPLTAPPEGSWSCHLCIEEYHKPKVAT